jgi:polyisoprenyl-phosphate glycosyltransferase
MIARIQKNNDFLVSIIAPVFNEEKCIEPFVEAIQKELGLHSYNFEIIFINDGSDDETEALINKIALEHHKIKLISFSRNFGKDIALTAGLDFSDGDMVIPIDVDLQHPPSIIPKMISLWQQGYDVVNARRSDLDQETIFKRFFSKIFYFIFNSLSSMPLPAKIGDFRLLDREVVLQLRNLREAHRFMKGLFAWVGYNQIAITYNRPNRMYGHTKWQFTSLFNFAINGITSFSVSLLRLSMIIGFAVSFLGFIYAGFTIYQTIIFGIDVPGYASLIILVLILGGVQLISMGIQGEYIGKIYEQVKDRPLYIIKNKNF